MSSSERDLFLVEDLISREKESDWIEFKRDNSDPEVIGKLCSALSNGARIADEDHAYVVWGVDDESTSIVGTDFDPSTKKAGNQTLEFWLAQLLQPSVQFCFRTVPHPKGRVVLLEIPAALSAPVSFRRIEYIRIGETPEPAHRRTISETSPVFAGRRTARAFPVRNLRQSVRYGTASAPTSTLAVPRSALNFSRRSFMSACVSTSTALNINHAE